MSGLILARIPEASATPAWVSLSSGVSNTFLGVDAIGDSIWAVGSSGMIRRSTDKGLTWSTQSSGTTFTLYSIDMFSSLVGWAVGSSGVIRKTTDGGVNWVTQGSGVTSVTLRSVKAVSSTVVYAIGSADTFVKTTSGGDSWTASDVFAPAEPTLTAIDCPSMTICYAVGLTFAFFGDPTEDAIFKTVDGASWSKIGSLSGADEVNFRGVSCATPDICWIVGDSGSIYKTTNGGADWTKQGAGVTTVTLNDVFAVNTSEVFVVGFLGTILRTTNGGTSWTVMSSPTTSTLYSIDAVTATRVVAVGLVGKVIRYSDFDFALSGVPSSRTVAAGSSTTFSLTVTLLGGVTQSVTLGVTGLPAGASGAFSAVSGNPTLTSTLTITTTGATPTATSTLAISATGGGITRTISRTLIVTAAPDFSVEATPSALSGDLGSSVTVTATVNSVAGFSSAVTLSLTGAPSGITSSIPLNPVTPPSGGSTTSTITVVIGGATVPGTYTLTVNGVSGALAPRSDTFDLTVNAPPPPPAFDFEIDVTSAPSITMSPGGTATYGLSINLLAGSPAAVSLSASGLPGGASSSFTPATGTPTFGNSLSIATVAASPLGSYTITITGVSGATTRTTDVGLVLAAPPAFDFSLAASPGSRTVTPGGSATYSLTVALTSGTAGPVSLSASGLPAGASSSFSPATGTPTFTSTLTVSTTGATPAGTYTLSVAGAAGAVTKTTTVTLIVSTSPKACVIATATYGSELSEKVVFLRDFRDRKVMATRAGSEFMSSFNAWYYGFSPAVAAQIQTNEVAQTVMRVMLYPTMAALQVASVSYDMLSFNQELAIISSGMVASALLGLAYLAVPIGLTLQAVGRRIRRLTARQVGFLSAVASVAIGATTIGEILGLTSFIQLGTSVLVLSTIAFVSLVGISTISRIQGSKRSALSGS